MNGATATLVFLSFGQLAGRRRLWLVGLLSLLPVAVASVFLAVGRADPDRWTATVLMNGIVVTAIAPLVSLLTSTAAMGSELEEGTMLFLLTKPVARWRIVAAKLAVAATVSVAAVVAAAGVAGVIATWDGGDRGAVAGFVAAAALGTLAYCAVFTALAALTSRALIVGLSYASVWEGVVSSLFEGAKYLSIRRFTLGLADELAGLPPSQFSEPLPAAPVLLPMAVAAGFLAALWALHRFEARGAG